MEWNEPGGMPDRPQVELPELPERFGGYAGARLNQEGTVVMELYIEANFADPDMLPPQKVDLYTAAQMHAYARQAIAESEARAEGDARNAARYRWLRDESGNDIDAPFVCGVHGAPMGDDGWLTGELLDEAVDAAMNGANA